MASSICADCQGSSGLVPSPEVYETASAGSSRADYLGVAARLHATTPTPMTENARPGLTRPSQRGDPPPQAGGGELAPDSRRRAGGSMEFAFGVCVSFSQSPGLFERCRRLAHPRLSADWPSRKMGAALDPRLGTRVTRRAGPEDRGCWSLAVRANCESAGSGAVDAAGLPLAGLR
jgi:hypothetical protein